MVIVHFMGGLGNQMFQYAAGKSLAMHHGVPLKAYFEDKYKYAKRQFALSPFRLTIEFATRKDYPEYFPKYRLKRRIFGLLKKNVDGLMYREKTPFKFDNEFFSLPSNVMLYGFWQSPRYFQHIRNTLSNDFSLKTLPTGKNLEFIQEIKASKEPVAVHIRRGDYVTHPKQSGFFSLPLSYYYDAIKYLRRKIGEIVLFVFSDDMDWVKQNFRPDLKIIYCDQNTSNQAHEDLRLMSLCKHHVIANSSFSWWGAWLSSQDGITIAPGQWSQKHFTRDLDLVPNEWIVFDIQR
ncbi:MAG: alpha-1,2-fucosyltransferase [Methanobacteriota archaeon]|nr:MAG: alpha-1,2-fucosyltransferase [Euryarchaeota archaeon]